MAAHFRHATLKEPCPSCGGVKVTFEMIRISLDRKSYSYRVGHCRDCGRKRFGGLRVGISNLRPEGHPLDPHKCHYEVPTDRWGRSFAQCTYKKGQGPEGRYCAPHARQVAERADAAARFQETIAARGAAS